MTNVSYPNTNTLQQQQPQPQHTVLTPPIQQQPYYYTVNTPLLPTREPCREDKHKSDRAFSVTFFVLGFFMFFPFFFNFVYLKSPHCYARKISFASLVIGTLYLCAFIINFGIFYLGMRCWNGYYYDFC